MKYKEILKVPFKAPEQIAEQEQRITAQVLDDRYLILDLWEGKMKLKSRHVTDLNTGEPATYHPDTDKWDRKNLNGAADITYCYYFGYEINEKEWKLTKTEKNLITSVTEECYRSGVYNRVLQMEERYNRTRRQNAEASKYRRLNELMEKCLGPGRKVYEWAAQAAVGDLNYAFYRKNEKTYHCTSCERDFTEEAAGVKIRNKDKVGCPLCGCMLIAEKRRTSVRLSTRLSMIHNVDEKRGVHRHFIVTIKWEERREVYFEEIIRLMMLRNIVILQFIRTQNHLFPVKISKSQYQII